jgi:ATP-dependent Lon protease
MRLFEMDELDRKALAHFPGRVVRKDLLGPLKGHLNVPTYVLEYLLGKYCSSSDPEVIQKGIEEVKRILTENYVHPDSAELFKSRVKELGRHRVIDKVKVRLHETEDKYWAELVNLQLDHVNIDEEIVNRYEKLLAGGLWGIVDLTYRTDLYHKGVLRPFMIEQLRPIQLEVTALKEIKDKRREFTREEWIDLLIRSVGLEPSHFDARLKLLILCRLIPFVENNYNFVELGPRGTGKSYVYRELSPYCILVSGGETTVPSLFVSHVGRGKLGLVALWDTVAFDEVAGLEKLSNAAAVQILKDYMESGSFSRGREEINALASLVFVGNIDFDIQEMLSTSHLFIPFPEQMQDPAFFDRFHIFLPGWEMPRMRPEFMCKHYGFVVDYLSWFLHELRSSTFSEALDKYFRLGGSLDKRDERAVRKTVSGLIKIIHPDGNYTKEDVEEYLTAALEMRRRVKEQLKKMRSSEYWRTELSYIDLDTSREVVIPVPEQPSRVELPTEPRIGEVVGLAVISGYGGGTIQRFEVIADKGSGRLIPLGSMMRVMRESLKAAYEYISHNHSGLGIDVDYKKDYDITVLATQMGVPKEGASAGITILVGLVSALTKKPVKNGIAMTGEITILGRILPVEGMHEKLLAASEAGLRTVYVPKGNEKDVQMLPSAIRNKIDIKLVSRVEEVLNEVLVDYRTVEKADILQAGEGSSNEVHMILSEVENNIRNCIEERLERISANWWGERVPPDVRQKAEERKMKERGSFHPIHYVDFPDYLKIITRKDNWREAFSTVFRDQAIIIAKIRELEPIRNAIAHNRPLTSEEIEKLKLLARDINRLILLAST